uniref:PH domain-containing protein n=1 Tax=Globisporangium ultimum (strain ATCC 200006 / CBS 805.95 / DAOM BR144) TaxID=431595 RepID=K3XB28_GLOUD
MDEQRQRSLSGFLEYKKLDGSWRPFLFQTLEYQLMVYRVHPTHQVTVMSTDIRKATEITLAYENGN